MRIVPVTNENKHEWAKLCNELWPHNPVDDMFEAFLCGELKHEYLCLVGNAAVAFISLSLRHDYVEGKTDQNPVGYLEGIYVKPEHRKQGIARGLVAFARQWAAGHGCTMFASDCELANNESRQFHNKMGFAEASINVHFAMPL